MDRARRLHGRPAAEVLPAHARAARSGCGRGYFITATDAVTDADGNVIEVRATYDPETRGGQAPDGRKVKATIHWVSAAHAVDGTVHLYERLFTDSHPGADGADPMDALDPTSRGPRSRPSSSRRSPTPSRAPSCSSSGSATSPPTPTSRRTFHRTVGLRDEWANIQKRKQ